MRTPIIVSICCLIIAITVTAQTEATNCIHEKGIKGIIVGIDKEPLPFVNVVLLNDSTFVAGVTTDEQGRFAFDYPSSSANKIKIAMVGYEDYFAPITQSEDLGIIMLKESSIMLNEVVVKANLPITRLKGNTMVTSVQNTALAKMGNAYDVLSHIPMVTGINGELNVFPVFRNGTPESHSGQFDQRLLLFSHSEYDMPLLFGIR